MIRYDIHLELRYKESPCYDIQHSKIVCLQSEELILVNGDVLEWLPVKDLDQLTTYDSVVEFTLEYGKVF